VASAQTTAETRRMRVRTIRSWRAGCWWLRARLAEGQWVRQRR
jgi:hypothetical protein